MKIIYYVPEILSLKRNLTLNIAPRRRAFYIKQALENQAEVYTICGNKNERQELIKQFFNNYSFSDFAGMYVESMNWPLRFFDYDFFYKASKKIPITIFYRDCYWKFTKTDYKLNSFKRIVGFFRFQLEFLFFKNVFHHIFVPSLKFGEFLKLDKFSELYPAAQTRLLPKFDYESKEFGIVFAGSYKVGTEILIKIALKMKELRENVKFYVITSNPEKFKIKDSSLITFLDTTFDNNSEILYKCHLGINPFFNSEYYDFAVSVKLFDYLSYGLPVLFTNNGGMKDLINKSKIGKTVDYNVDEFVKAIIEMMDNKNLYKELRENVKKVVETTHNWDRRAETILKKIKELSGKR